MKNNKFEIKKGVVSLCILIGLMLPLIVKDYHILHLIIAIIIWSILTLGIRLVLTAGHLNVAQASFMGMGAYASGALALKLGWNFWVCMPLAGLISAMLAVIIGIPTLRIKGAYFVIITLGLSEVCRRVWMMSYNLFGGPQGLLGIPTPDPINIGSFSVNFDSKVDFFYLAFFLLLMTLFVMWRFEKSRAFLILRSLPQSDLLAECSGVNIMKYKVVAFAIGAFFAGLAGSFWAHYYTYCSPWDFTLHASFYMLMYAVVGGTGTILGPMLGSAFMITIEELLRPFQELVPLILGSILVIILLFIPGGLISVPGRVSHAIKSMKRRMS